jgi:hypothetical protein
LRHPPADPNPGNSQRMRGTLAFLDFLRQLAKALCL